MRVSGEEIASLSQHQCLNITNTWVVLTFQMLLLVTIMYFIKQRNGTKLSSSILSILLWWTALFCTVNSQNPRTTPLCPRNCSENNWFLNLSEIPQSHQHPLHALQIHHPKHACLNIWKFYQIKQWNIHKITKSSSAWSSCIVSETAEYV